MIPGVVIEARFGEWAADLFVTTSVNVRAQAGQKDRTIQPSL